MPSITLNYETADGPALAKAICIAHNLEPYNEANAKQGLKEYAEDLVRKEREREATVVVPKIT